MHLFVYQFILQRNKPFQTIIKYLQIWVVYMIYIWYMNWRTSLTETFLLNFLIFFTSEVVCPHNFLTFCDIWYTCEYMIIRSKCTEHNREVKHYWYDKWQRTKTELLPSVKKYLYLWWIVRDVFSYFCVFFKELDEKNTKSNYVFAICHKHYAKPLMFTINRPFRP